MNRNQRIIQLLKLLVDDPELAKLLKSVVDDEDLSPGAVRRRAQMRMPKSRAGSHTVKHDISTQDECEEVTAAPSRDHRWYQGLSRCVDQEVLGGRIVAYKIRWSNGKWSRWFVPGVNDIDHKHNDSNYPGNLAAHNTMRRMWSYFHDHEHRYIIQRSRPDPGRDAAWVAAEQPPDARVRLLSQRRSYRPN